MAVAFAKVVLGVFLMTVFGWAVFVYAVLSVPQADAPLPAYTVEATASPALSAASWAVFDAELGEVLYIYNADTPRPIASVTKLATAARFLETNNMSETATVTAADVATYGRAGKLENGDTHTKHELLFPLLLESSNDAAETLARVDTSLVDRMNALRDELSLHETAFADPSGLSRNNISTARELMHLARYMYAEYPHVLRISRMHEYYAQDNGWFNNNPFIDDTAYRGGKHGYTDAAKLTAVAFFDEPLAGDATRTLGYVMLGSDDLRTDMATLRMFVRGHTAYR